MLASCTIVSIVASLFHRYLLSKLIIINSDKYFNEKPWKIKQVCVRDKLKQLKAFILLFLIIVTQVDISLSYEKCNIS